MSVYTWPYTAYTVLPQIDDEQCYILPVRKRAPQITRSNSLRCVPAAEHHTAKKYSETSRAKHQKYLTRSYLLWNTSQNFLKIPSLWEAALETEWICFSKKKKIKKKMFIQIKKHLTLDVYILKLKLSFNYSY